MKNESADVTVPCKGCDAEMIWAMTPDGKRIPLDATAPVYFLTAEGTAIRAVGYYVSHFKTCPRANEFSASKRGRPATPEPRKESGPGQESGHADTDDAGRPEESREGT